MIGSDIIIEDKRVLEMILEKFYGIGINLNANNVESLTIHHRGVKDKISIRCCNYLSCDSVKEYYTTYAIEIDDIWADVIIKDGKMSLEFHGTEGLDGYFDPKFEIPLQLG